MENLTEKELLTNLLKEVKVLATQVAKLQAEHTQQQEYLRSIWQYIEY